MKERASLKAILVLAIAGMLFSGYLSYTELFAKFCALGGGCSSISGIPACVYGFFMYLIIVILAILGLKRKRKNAR